MCAMPSVDVALVRRQQPSVHRAWPPRRRGPGGAGDVDRRRGARAASVVVACHEHQAPRFLGHDAGELDGRRVGRRRSSIARRNASNAASASPTAHALRPSIV